MSVKSTQDLIDSAGRLTAYLNEQLAECNVLDVLVWCAEANVGLYRSTEDANTAYNQLVGEP